MRYAQKLAILAVMALPFGAMAHDASAVTSEAVPVVKVSSNVNTTGIVSTRISDTAAPATNKAVRENSDKEARASMMVMAPNANSFYQRLQVGVVPVAVKGNHMDITYPEVTSVSKTVQKKINKAISDYVEDLQEDLAKANLKNDNATNLYITYDVKANGNGLFSVLIKSYTIQDKAANGNNTVKAFTFNTTSGQRVSLSDFGGVNKEKLQQALADAPEDFKTAVNSGIMKDKQRDINVPKEFYSTEDHNVFLIFQQGDIAARAAGTLYLPMGKLSDK